jgi:hypothetical protein
LARLRRIRDGLMLRPIRIVRMPVTDELPHTKRALQRFENNSAVEALFQIASGLISG